MRIWIKSVLLAIGEWLLFTMAVVVWHLYLIATERATGIGLVANSTVLMWIVLLLFGLTVVNYLVLRWMRARREPRPPLAFPDSSR